MEEKHRDFFPIGAIYFMIFMVAFYAFIWFFVFKVLLERG